MAKTTRKKQRENKNPKVWRIYHFKERFEMDGYVRQNGLDYLRMFVTATTKDKSNESTEFLAQLTEMEHYYPEQRDAYEGRFWRLCRLTGPLEQWLRGYLVDADQKPLGIAKLAARLHLSQGVMKQTLLALKRAGLVECVECPAFERPAAQEAPEKEDRRRYRGKDKRPKTPGARAAAKAISNHFETFSKTPKTFKRESNTNRTRIEEQKRNLGLSSSDPTRTEDQAATSPQELSQGQPPRQGATALSPTTAPPIDPTLSDAGGAVKVIAFPDPPGSVHSSEPSHISHSLAGIRRRCNPAARAAAEQLYAVFGGPWPKGSREEAQDLGCFRSAFERALNCGLSPPAMQQLWDELLAEAKRLRRLYANNGGYVSAKRVWFKPYLRDKLKSRCKVM